MMIYMYTMLYHVYKHGSMFPVTKFHVNKPSIAWTNNIKIDCISIIKSPQSGVTIKSPQCGVTLCFQFVSAAFAATTGSAASTTFAAHVKTVWAKP